MNNKNEVMDRNRIIAEFMGATYNGSGVQFTHPPIDLHGNRKTIYHLDDVIYDISWDWLMPVWRKIKADLSDNDVLYMSTLTAIADVDIEKAFTLLSEAVQWYNQNKQLSPG